MTVILIAEDEPQIAALVRRGLEHAGYQTILADDGADALRIALTGEVDLVLLDVGLPTMDGFDVLREIRRQNAVLPVVMLTARTSTRDTVEGLDAGASDYVRKPFTFEELLARVRSRLRETERGSAVVLTHGDVTLDIRSRNALVRGREVELSAREFALAREFLRHPGEVLSREQLLSRVWGLDFDPGSNVVDVYVRYLRAKFGHERIATIRGVGYRWD